MSDGRLDKAILVANTDTVLYTAPANCRVVKTIINMLNNGVGDSVVKLAISTTGTPAASDYIEDGGVVPANGGILLRGDVYLSPGESIIARSTTATTVVRVSGEVLI